MIPLAGTLQEESFTATFGKRGDVTVTIDGQRGCDLAQALGGRRLPIGYRGCAAYDFTPARAEKWHALWIAGFSVRAVRVEDVTHWRYAGCGQENLIRRQALALAREQGAELDADKARHRCEHPSFTD